MAAGQTREDAGRGAGLFGEFRLWEQGEDNSDQLDRLRRNLRLARQSELTERQREVLRLRYEEGMSLSAIALRLQVNKSTVSRTVNRGKKRLRKYLQYSL